MTEQSRTDETPDPEGLGQEQEESQTQQPPAKGPTPEEIQATQERLATLEAENKRLLKLSADREREARQHQRTSDRLQRQLAGRSPNPATLPRPGFLPDRMQQPNPNAQPTPDLEAQGEVLRLQMDNLRLRKMRDLELEDGDIDEGLEFQTETELVTYLETVKTRKDLTAMRTAPPQSQTSGETAGAGEGGAGAQPPSAPGTGRSRTLIDTGGPTGREAPARQQKLDRMRAKAAELRKNGQYESGAHLALRAAHNDPSKVINSPEEDDLDRVNL